MPKWNFAAMGQAWRWARPGDGPGLAMALVNFVRTVDTVIKAGRTGRQPADDPPANGT